jgi:hypothetical protein
MAVGIRLGRHELWDAAKPWWHYYPILENGENIGYLNISISPDGKIAHIINIQVDTDNAANRLGPSAVRHLFRNFFIRNPDVQRVEGKRIGARFYTKNKDQMVGLNRSGFKLLADFQ